MPRDQGKKQPRKRVFEKLSCVSFAGEVPGFEAGSEEEAKALTAICFTQQFPLTVDLCLDEDATLTDDLLRDLAREVHCAASKNAVMGRFFDKYSLLTRYKSISRAELKAAFDPYVQVGVVVDPEVYAACVAPT